MRSLHPQTFQRAQYALSAPVQRLACLRSQAVTGSSSSSSSSSSRRARCYATAEYVIVFFCFGLDLVMCLGDLILYAGLYARLTAIVGNDCCCFPGPLLGQNQQQQYHHHQQQQQQMQRLGKTARKATNNPTKSRRSNSSSKHQHQQQKTSGPCELTR